MKPTSPEEHEPEDVNAELSERYRACSRDEPSARVDALIAEAARREAGQVPRQRSNWRMPASIAAVLVIGVSLVLMVRDNEPPLSSMEQFSDEGRLARPAAPSLAMKAAPKSEAAAPREDRPSRERSARPDREPGARDETAARTQGDLSRAPGSAASPAVPVPAPAASNEQKSAPAKQRQYSAQDSANLRDQADTPSLNEQASKSTRKETTEAPRPGDLIEKIDELLRAGKQDEARRQLFNFRQRYPDYGLPARLQALLPPDRRSP